MFTPPPMNQLMAYGRKGGEGGAAEASDMGTSKRYEMGKGGAWYPSIRTPLHHCMI